MDKKTSENHKRVIIIGGGPTGLSLGLGLAKQGVKSIILEKKEELSRHSRAPVIHQRTREISGYGVWKRSF
jgi:2-polyprenyl-6-methoxyphenol hydroxylase-like FAD-dependent oxidoreductase